MKFILIVWAVISTGDGAKTFTSPSYYFDTLQACQERGLEVTSRVHQTDLFKIGVGCFEVHK